MKALDVHRELALSRVMMEYELLPIFSQSLLAHPTSTLYFPNTLLEPLKKIHSNKLLYCVCYCEMKGNGI